MNRILLATLALAVSQGAAALDGPYSHLSDGYTQPTIVYDSSGTRILYADCRPGSRCAIQTGTRALGRYDTQTMTFDLQTGGTVPDHYAFGVRGNQSNLACVGKMPIDSFPLLGRGIAVYPGREKIYFENFTEACVNRLVPDTGLLHSTGAWARFEPNTLYKVTLWANDANVGAIVYKQERTAYGPRDVPVFAADCLSSASTDERYLCRSYDEPNANRTFIANTADAFWIVNNWYID